MCLAIHAHKPNVYVESFQSSSLSRTAARFRLAMLKIVRSANSAAVVYFLSGRIDEEHIAALQAAFDADTLPIRLDLDEVTRVDRETVPTLARWNAQGIRFLNCPAYLRNWIWKARGQDDS